MIKLKNPYINISGYNCFGCSPTNLRGLNLEFFEDDDMIVAKWLPKSDFQGWFNTLHGGIQSSLHDEIASWVVFIKLKTSGVTTNLNITYRKTVSTNNEELILKAKLVEQRRNIAIINTSLYDKVGNMCSEAVIKYFIFPVEVAKEKYYYPGYEAFYK